MNFSYGVIGVLTLLSAAFLNSGPAAICGVILIIAADVVGYLEKILVELRTTRPTTSPPRDE